MIRFMDSDVSAATLPAVRSAALAPVRRVAVQRPERASSLTRMGELLRELLYPSEEAELMPVQRTEASAISPGIDAVVRDLHERISQGEARLNGVRRVMPADYAPSQSPVPAMVDQILDNAKRVKTWERPMQVFD